MKLRCVISEKILFSYIIWVYVWISFLNYNRGLTISNSSLILRILLCLSWRFLLLGRLLLVRLLLLVWLLLVRIRLMLGLDIRLNLFLILFVFILIWALSCASCGTADHRWLFLECLSWTCSCRLLISLICIFSYLPLLDTNY